MYIGKEATACDPIVDDLATIVVVSGSTGNPCGHGLLKWGGNYYHVAGVYARPHVMDDDGFKRYLRDHGKRVMERLPVYIRDRHAAYDRLTTLIAQPWLWGIVPHNCFRFLESVVQAGGGDYSLLTNCHILEGA